MIVTFHGNLEAQSFYNSQDGKNIGDTVTDAGRGEQNEHSIVINYRKECIALSPIG